MIQNILIVISLGLSIYNTVMVRRIIISIRLTNKVLNETREMVSIHERKIKKLQSV